MSLSRPLLGTIDSNNQNLFYGKQKSITKGDAFLNYRFKKFIGQLRA